MSGFLQALPVTLEFEGGYADHPDDPGGATNMGITQATYDRWRRRMGESARPVREIRESEVQAIYHEDYWTAGACDSLPWPASLAHFDACVNHGIRAAWRLVQRAAGSTPDGIPGPNTYAAAGSIPVPLLVSRMLWERLRYYEEIMVRRSRSRTFCLGWLSRVNHLRATIRRDHPEVP